MDWSTLLAGLTGGGSGGAGGGLGSLFGSLGGGAMPPGAASPGDPLGKGGAPSPQGAAGAQGPNMQMAKFGMGMMPQAPAPVAMQPIHYARAPGLLNQY